MRKKIKKYLKIKYWNISYFVRSWCGCAIPNWKEIWL